MFTYKAKGVCAKEIQLDIDNGIIKSVKFIGGCNGNTKGIGALAEGMEINEFIKRCKDIKCGIKNTSCPAQLCEALVAAQNNLN